MAALRAIARDIDVPNELTIYDNLPKNHSGSHSYSFETRVSYNAEIANDRNELLRLYSDGIHPINMLALDDAFNRTLARPSAIAAAHLAVSMGFVPFAGYWNTPDGFFTGISIALNHGVSDPDVIKTLKSHSQMFAARIFPDRTQLFP